MGRPRTGRWRRSICAVCGKQFSSYQRQYEIKAGKELRSCSRSCRAGLRWIGKKKYNPDLDKLKRLYLVENMSMRQIEKRIFGVNQGGQRAVYYVKKLHLHRPEPLRDNDRPILNFQIDKVVTLYSSGRSPQWIAQQWGCSRSYIVMCLVKRGIKLRQKHGNPPTLVCIEPNCNKPPEKRCDSKGRLHGTRCRFHRLLHKSQTRHDYVPVAERKKHPKPII